MSERHAPRTPLLAACLARLLVLGCASAGTGGIDHIVTTRVHVVNDLTRVASVKIWLIPVWGDPSDRAHNEPNVWRSSRFAVGDTTRTVDWHLQGEAVEIH